ncbi:MAG: cupin domain-containing protein, partial [Tatlockia sp.]|nr:cupin domain-containing protein [Tatlockia sp.]
GSVGPHYDNYDVFLYQAKGRRKWSLTTENCNETNFLTDVELRIMRQFQVEEEYILEEGDMLYLPPHVGHYGKAISAECMTFSFGYRSYQGQEIWDSFAEYLSEQKPATLLYEDPNWCSNRATSLVPRQAWLNAKKLMLKLLDDESRLQKWFGSFVTQLDQQAEALLPIPIDNEIDNLADFMTELNHSAGLRRNAVCRFAYQQLQGSKETVVLFINGCEWDVKHLSIDLIKLVADSRWLSNEALKPFLRSEKNQSFLYELWRLQWLDME